MPFKIAPSRTEIETAVKNAMDAQGYTSARAARLDNLDAPVSSRLDLTSLRSELDNRGVTLARMQKLDGLFQPVSNSGSVAAADNTAGLEVVLDTGYRQIVEVVYSCGAACTVEVYESDDGTNWLLTDTITENAAVTNKIAGYLNTRRYVKVRIPTTGIDASILVIAL